MRLVRQHLQHPWHALIGEARLLLQLTADRLLLLLVILAALVLWLAIQPPFAYTIDVGREDGPGSDLPLVAGFYPVEQSAAGSFRWTRARSELRLPGLGVRPVQLAVRTLAISDEIRDLGPQELVVLIGDQALAQLPVAQSGRLYRMLVPPQPGGDLFVSIQSTTLIPAGDQRAVGVPVTTIQASWYHGAWPATSSTWLWLASLVPAWLALRRSGLDRRHTLLIMLVGVALAATAAWLDPPRFAFGAAVALSTLGLGLLLVLLLCAPADALHAAGGVALLVAAIAAAAGSPFTAPITLTALALLLGSRLRPGLAQLYIRLGGIPISAASWRVLVLIALIVFGMRFGGKLYPDAMPGDIGFHANRYTEVVYGRPLLLSRNRGVDFPYPSALYLLIAPLATIEPDVRLMLRLSSALLDALSPFLVYTIAAALIGQGGRWPLAAAALYSLSGALTMTSWWNFSTHIFTQFAHLLLLATLVLAWPQLVAGQIRRHTAVAALLFLQSLVYLGHFGFWINMSLLGGFGLLLLAWHARRARQYRGLLATLLLSFTLAELIATGLFYSSYLALFTAQAQIAADGGLSGLAAREPVAATLLWETLWDAGLRMHFGFFPVPLALGGMLIAVLQLRRYRIEQRQVLIGILLAGTMLVAGIFALLPFVTGAALTTRWLMFAAWAVAVGAVASGARIWQAGQAGRVLLLAAAAYALAITAAMWLAALAWRVRPPEPF